MTSREFIEREFDNPGREKYCASIYKDSQGNIYSYGTHYPLLFKIGGLTFRNTSGYSVTTAKHIGWCYGFNAIDVEVDGDIKYKLFTSAYTVSEKLDMLRKCLLKEIKRIENEMESKKRKDTQVYQWLEFDRANAVSRLNRVNEYAGMTV